LKGRLVIDINDHGLLGSPEAESVVIELVDYKCPDCRQVHQYLKEVREKLGSRFAVVVFPVPLETDCNPYIRSTHSKHVGACKYAKLALAVFTVAPRKFEQFHDWMMDTKEPPSFEEATRYANDLVGPEHDLGQGESTRLKDYVRLYNVANIQRLPAMIIGDKVMIGVPKSANAVLQMIQPNSG
jgi:protein-disulfide isomerase